MDESLGDHWGKLASIDLFGCDPLRISNPVIIREFVEQLVKIINMVPHGPVYIDRFGNGTLEGYSAMQFIETSSITVHADETKDRCFIDVFSCKNFDEKKAEEFAKEYFSARESKITCLLR